MPVQRAIGVVVKIIRPNSRSNNVRASFQQKNAAQRGFAAACGPEFRKSLVPGPMGQIFASVRCSSFVGPLNRETPKLVPVFVAQEKCDGHELLGQRADWPGWFVGAEDFG